MHTKENWPKIIGLLLVCSLVVTMLRTGSWIFLSGDPVSYFVCIPFIFFFIYLGLSREAAQSIRHFVEKESFSASIILISYAIQVIGISMSFPRIGFQDLAYIGLPNLMPSVFFQMLIFTFVIPCVLLPYYFSYRICVKKNRDPLKGIVLTLIFWPITPLALWLGLKTRDPKTKHLY